MVADFDGPASARRLMAEGRSAALGTLGEAGEPFVSFVITAAAADGSPTLLLSRLAAHSRNLERDPRASLLFVEAADAEGGTMAVSRVTLVGDVVRDDAPETRAAFLERHPDAALYAGFTDFSFYRFRISEGHLVAGFGRILNLQPEDLLQDTGPSTSA